MKQSGMSNLLALFIFALITPLIYFIVLALSNTSLITLSSGGAVVDASPMSPFIFLITGTGLILYFLMVISLMLAAYFPAIMRLVNNRSTTSQASQSRPTAGRSALKTSARPATSQPAAVPSVNDGSASSDDSEVIGTDSGTVKWFNVKKGFGFITLENGEEIFVHFRSIRGSGHRHLKPGQDVKFNIVEGEKGPQAEDVSILGDD